jgi:hypothetical protein
VIDKKMDMDRVIAVLNSAVQADPDAMRALVETRIPCNMKLAEHPTIQIAADLDGQGGYTNPRIGFLGVLNGLFGMNDKGQGGIVGDFAIVCPDGHTVSGGMKAGDECLQCEEKIVLGELRGFKERKQ